MTPEQPTLPVCQGNENRCLAFALPGGKYCTVHEKHGKAYRSGDAKKPTRTVTSECHQCGGGGKCDGEMECMSCGHTSFLDHECSECEGSGYADIEEEIVEDDEEDAG